MKRQLTVRGVVIGTGMPKVCVPLTGKSISELREEAALIKSVDADMVEWRADFFNDIEEFEEVMAALTVIRSSLPEIPLIFTFRSSKEGGEKELSLEGYVKLNERVTESGLVDFIDVELFSDEGTVKRLVKTAHENRVLVIVSTHDFEKTPPKEEILYRLRKAQELGADLPKIAVMPKDASDVLTLLEASHMMSTQYADRPIVAISMAGTGMVSRLSGELFGSALTFATAKKASAPGQMPAAELKKVLSLLHYQG
ncbi:3-dehydroquinate dehydratase [Mesobacillus campisalis]|uniref:3-dehydroquinate dehydratase n=1 Tax=Mesobacillus campisalis TaxID=1408103 RepID=A0A0M2SIB0_9BACI|nr:type I 3-dehydroquinate dehydratase [Mesobacillus campisalis]KKK34429.1 3-dehydroquinate dehydratase [Mesobacillus campisalis]